MLPWAWTYLTYYRCYFLHMMILQFKRYVFFILHFRSALPGLDHSYILQILQFAPSILNFESYILHLTSYILHLTPYILNLKSYIFYLTSYILYISIRSSAARAWTDDGKTGLNRWWRNNSPLIDQTWIRYREMGQAWARGKTSLYTGKHHHHHKPINIIIYYLQYFFPQLLSFSSTKVNESYFLIWYLQ